MLKSLLLLCLVCLPWQMSALVKRDSVYMISTADDLEEFAQLVNNGEYGANAILTNDIDFSGHTTMIAQTKHYHGTFDGQSHTIKVNYHFDVPTSALFRYVDHGGRIINLHVDGTITSSQRYAAGIVAKLYGGELNNCLSTVTVHSTYQGDCTLGGIAGFVKNRNRLTNCVFVGSLQAPNGRRVGGLIGWVDEPLTVLQNCLVICQAEVQSLESSNSVVRTLKPEYVVLDNVRYVNDINQSIDGAKKISLDEYLNGATYYKLFTMQLHDIEQQVVEKDHQLHTVYMLMLGGLLMLIVQSVLLFIYYTVSKRIRRKLLRQYQDFVRVKAELAALTGVNAVSDQDDDDCDEETLPDDEPDLDESADDTSVNLQILYQKLLLVMEQKQLYTNPKMNLQLLARELCTNQSRLSTCINRISGKNLSTWLGQYRVAYAMKLMDEDPSLREEEIRERSGFSSHSSYYRIFNKVTGYTPKQYLATRILTK